MDIRVDGKSVFITGGTGTLGSALIEIFSQNGGVVQFQYYHNEERAFQLEKSFGAKPNKIDFLRTFQLPNNEYDILINCAGINISKRLSLSVTSDEWVNTILVNTTAPYHLVKQCLPYMINKKWGRVVNISSIWGLVARVKNLPYNVSKHALSALTKTVAKEYAQYGITCNEVCPGPIDSELMDRIAEQKEKEDGIPKEIYFQSLCKEIPTARFAKPSEIAQLVLYLASEYSSQINGASIPIDGGFGLSQFTIGKVKKTVVQKRK